MNLLTQIAVVTLMNLRTLPRRTGNSLVIVIGIAGVVAVLVSVLSMSSGFRRTIDSGANPDRVVVLSRGAESEMISRLPRENIAAILDAPGIRRNGQGRPIASAELVVMAPVSQKSGGSDAFVTLRGVGPEVLALREEIRIVEGRMFHPAVRELLVGRAAQRQFLGLEIGNEVRLSDGDWKVVGVFETGGTAHESTLIADAETLLNAYREKTFFSMTVLLASQAAFGPFRDALTSNPALVVDVKREPEFVASLSQPLNRMLSFVAYAIGGIMAIGAVFGALNTMYSAVITRGVEIATLRAIGFQGGAVVVSVLVEALLLAALGAALGVALACLFIDGQTMSTVGNSIGYNPQLVYSLAITPDLMITGALVACFVGLIGGLFPAVRAARQSVAISLRAT